MRCGDAPDCIGVPLILVRTSIFFCLLILEHIVLPPFLFPYGQIDCLLSSLVLSSLSLSSMRDRASKYTTINSYTFGVFFFSRTGKTLSSSLLESTSPEDAYFLLTKKILDNILCCSGHWRIRKTHRRFRCVCMLKWRMECFFHSLFFFFTKIVPVSKLLLYLYL